MGRRRPIIGPDNFWSWFGGLMLAIGLPFLGFGFVAGRDVFSRDLPLLRDGVTTRGEVVGKFLEGTPGRSRTRRYVIYRFAPRDAVPQEGRAEVDEKTWGALERNGPVRVTFVAHSPQVHHMDGAFRHAVVEAVIFMGFGALLTLAGIVVLVRAPAMRRASARPDSGPRRRRRARAAHDARDAPADQGEPDRKAE
jgi:hypothetical protein